MKVSNEGYQCAPRAFLSLKVINKLQMTKVVVPSLQEESMWLFCSRNSLFPQTSFYGFLVILGKVIRRHFASSRLMQTNNSYDLYNLYD